MKLKKTVFKADISKFVKICKENVKKNIIYWIVNGAEYQWLESPDPTRKQVNTQKAW